jgi:hypothetical protein
MPKAMTVAEKDLLTDAIKKALRAVEGAQKAGYEDTRSSSSLCADHIDAALKSMQAASQWLTDLRREENINERPDPAPKAKPAPKVACHICEREIGPDDVAICGGCDSPTCQNCMGEDEVCIECESEPD